MKSLISALSFGSSVPSCESIATRQRQELEEGTLMPCTMTLDLLAGVVTWPGCRRCASPLSPAD